MNIWKLLSLQNFKQEKADQIETSESKAKISKAEIAYKVNVQQFYSSEKFMIQ